MSAETQAQMEAIEQQNQNQQEQTGINAAMQQAEQIQENLLEFLTQSDLSEGSKDLLRNYASKSFILGYLEDAEVQELKWDLRIYHEYYLALHPARECEVTGEVREWINDNPDDNLTKLSANQKMQVGTFFQGIWTNITRARGMKQQEIMQTQIAETRALRNKQDGGGGLWDRLSRS